MDDNQLKALYAADYFQGRDAHTYKNYVANEPIHRAGFRERLSAISQCRGITRPGSCFEIGCAFGFFLDEARKSGWTVRGIEISEHAAEYAQSRLSLDVSTDPEAIATIEPMSQDLVVMWDVIEHLPDPLGLLRQVRRVVRPNGLLVLSTGDIRSIGARFFGRRWYLVAPPYHLFYFDRESIQKMLEEAGFTVRTIASDGHPLENIGRNRFLQWVAQHDRYIGWRLNSGPVISVTATVG
jgi:2-polyprenyl-3-methyl-5-hydroxy-6-metoxy-1,4-benzoquinol methylase